MPISPLRKQFKGKVIEGIQEAQTLGFPTANISPDNLTLFKKMKDGVYSCYIWLGKNQYKGMGYLDKKRRPVIEAHLFGFEGVLYHKELSIFLKDHVRPPLKYVSPEGMKILLHQDAQRCLILLREEQ